PSRHGGTPLLAVDDAGEVLGSLAVGGAPCLCVMLGEHLRPVALALGDHADVEAGVEQLAGRELAKRKDRAVKHGVRTITLCLDGCAALGGRDCEGGPTFAAPALSAHRFVGHPADGRATSRASAPRFGWLPIQPERFVLEGDRLCPLVRDAEML